MSSFALLSDPALLAELGQRILHRRLARNLTQAQLAKEAGVSKSTVERIESGRSTQLTNLLRLFRALQLLDALNAMLPREAASPVEQLKRTTKKRRRASTPKPATNTPPPEPWKWGDTP